MKKMLATVLTIATLFVTGGWTNVQNQDVESEGNLINYLETHDVNNYGDFVDALEVITSHPVDERDVNQEEITYFSVEIDYDNMLVSVITMSEMASSRAIGIINSATKSYYTNAGIKKFTITVEGTFKYSSGSCTTLSCSGNFSKPVYSLWSSSPVVSSGNINSRKAYARVTGTATCGSDSTSYSLTLTCDDNGNFTSY